MKKSLEIGNPERRDDGWDTMDIEGGDIQHDIRHPFPIISNTYGVVYMSHVLEHIPWFETVEVLKEVHRILEPNGFIEVHVPDFLKIVTAYLEGNTGDDNWWEYNEKHDLDLWLNGRVFTYGEYPNWHRALFSERHLRNCLREAGFKNIVICKPRKDNHGWINLGLKGEK